MKIKTYDFEICNPSCTPGVEKKLSAWVIDDLKRQLTSAEEIDTIINTFIKDKNIYGIKTDIYTAETHNNGLYDWVHALYTISYEG